MSIKREHAMTIVAAARGDGRYQSMAKPWEYSLAGAVVVRGVFLKGFREGIARGHAYRRDAVVGSKSLAISLGTLLPLGRAVGRLIDAGHEGCADDGEGAEPIEKVVMEFGFLSRTGVKQVGLPGG